MARPKKTGLEYFPFDVDFFSDIKIRKLIKYQSGKAITVYALLLCNIYKNGYYMRWDNELPFIISEASGYEEAYITEVIRCCLQVGLFDKDLYEIDGVLTSAGIQERYRNICQMCRRICVISEYSLINDEGTIVSSEETHINSEETIVNSEKSTQSKVKERKVNYSSCDGAAVKKQKEQFIFMIFFFKNFTDPAGEARRFIAWNDVRGWKASNGSKITTDSQLKAAAMMWKPENPEPRMSEAFLRVWGALFSIAPESLKPRFADTRVNFLMKSGQWIITMPQPVDDWLRANETSEPGKLFKQFSYGHDVALKTF